MQWSRLIAWEGVITEDMNMYLYCFPKVRKFKKIARYLTCVLCARVRVYTCMRMCVLGNLRKQKVMLNLWVIIGINS